MTDILVNAEWDASANRPPPAAAPNMSSELPQAGSSGLEFPVLFPGLTEQNAETAKESWQVMKAAAEKLTATEHGSYSAATKETMDYGTKIMEMARLNTSAALELATALMAAKTPSEVIELSSAHARRQLNLIMEQNRQLWMAAQKITRIMLEPINKEVSKASEQSPSKTPDRRK